MRNDAAPLTVTRAGLVGALGIAAVALVCIRLGFWQLDRLEEKRALNAAVAERSALPPTSLAGPLLDTVGLILRQVTVQGEYDHERAVVLAGRSYRGIPGVHLLTPLQLPGGAAVLVNRGWLPSPDAATVELDAFAAAGPVELRGLVLPYPGDEDRAARRASEVQAAGVPPHRTVWYRLDGDGMAAQLPYPVLPIYVQALPDGTPENPPIRLPIPELDEGSHLSYAVQWFSFAAIFLTGGFVVLLRRGTGERVAPAGGRGSRRPAEGAPAGADGDGVAGGLRGGGG